MKDKTWLTATVIAVLIFIAVGTPFLLFTPPPPLPRKVELSKENLWREICKYPFQDCVLVWKSAIQESGHKLDSKNASKRNNLFGMKCNERIPECRNGYAVYEHWQYSVEDRFVHETLYRGGGSYRDYINRHWGIMDGAYCNQIDRIKFNLKPNNHE
jgi:hypothetical protein